LTTYVTSSSNGTTELSPSYRLPLTIVVIAVPLLLIQPWISLGLEIFGLFLVIQTATIRLKFTESALDVYRSEQLIRQFPYKDWQNWELFWVHLPILFYFREVGSIHFLPILFDVQTLHDCLNRHCPKT